MFEKVLLSVIAALSPIVFSYFFKILDNKKNSNVRKNELDEAQKRITFLTNYYEFQRNFADQDYLSSLKGQLSEEVRGIKQYIDGLYRPEASQGTKGLNAFQKIFLTFRPLSVWGWILHSLFYLDLLFLFFLVIGLGVDDNGNFSKEAFSNSIHDPELMLGSLFYIALLFLVRWLALMNYRKKSMAK